MMEILFPIRGPLNRIKGRGVVSVEYHRGSCHKTDVPDVHLLFRPSHLYESLLMSGTKDCSQNLAHSYVLS